VVIRFDPAATQRERAAARARVKATVARPLALPDSQLLQLHGATVKGAVAALNRRPGVRYAEPNQVASEQSCPNPSTTGLCVPNDPKYAQQWTFNNTAQAIDGKAGATVDSDADASEAWNIERGSSSVIVAVVDSGMAYDNPDFKDRIWHNAGEMGTDAQGRSKQSNGVDDDHNGYVDDWQGWDFVGRSTLSATDADNDPRDLLGHGSHVAGIIGANSNNKYGVAGLNWNVTLMNLRVRAARSNETSADIADAFIYAAKNGAKIVNASLAERDFSQYLRDAIAAHPETLYVIAAGNNAYSLDVAGNTSYPCAYPAANIVCVAATGRKDELATFSNWSKTQVDLAAPGTIELSTVPATSIVWNEAFDSNPFARWTRGGTAGSINAWGQSTDHFETSPTSLASHTGTAADKPGQVTWVQTATPVNLTGKQGCEVRTRVWQTADAASGLVIQARKDANFMAPSKLPAQDNNAANDTMSSLAGTSDRRIGVSIADIDGGPVYLRYGVFTNPLATATPPRTYIDTAQIACLSSTYSATGVTETAYMQGTSMATPHVAGTAALILSRFPGETTAQLKADLLRSVDPLTALATKVATGGRLNVYKALARSTVNVTGGVLTFRTIDGVRNNVSVTKVNTTTYRIKDPWAAKGTVPMRGSYLQPSAGCTRVSDTEAECTGVTKIDVDTGDMDDSIVATGATVPVRLAGGPGADALTGGSAADSFVGGPGNDTITSRDNLADAQFDCGEDGAGVTDTDKVLADLKDVVTASPTGCESVSKA
jgi:subtilisin family serine protease